MATESFVDVANRGDASIKLEVEMERQEYSSLLGRLPIKSPTPDDMAMLCPHLEVDEAVQAFLSCDGYVAVPPLRVCHGYLVLQFRSEWVEEVKVWRSVDGVDSQIVTGTKNHPSLLTWAFASRTPRSYAGSKKYGDVFSKSSYMGRAMRYAEANWGEDLVLDNWVSVVQIFVQDPTDLVNDRYHKGYPRTKAVLGVALSRELNDIINDGSKPQSVLFDDAVVAMALDHIEYAELTGGRGGYIRYACANCGGGLSLDRCMECGYTFCDDHFHSGCSTPLSRKMVAFLRRNGHAFAVDPEIAWAREQERWAKCHQ